MARRFFDCHRAAALKLLSNQRDLSRKEAGFLGQVCIAYDLTEKQRAWVVHLLARNKLPQLVDPDTASAGKR